MITVAADHFGIAAKQIVTDWLRAKKLPFEEFGSKDVEDEQSIADFIPKVAERVLRDPENRGIMICGTGIGVDIGANRFKGIRSVLAANPKLAEWTTRARARLSDLFPEGVACLGLTNDGEPKHPLYLRSDTQPIAFLGHGGPLLRGSRQQTVGDRGRGTAEG